MKLSLSEDDVIVPEEELLPFWLLPLVFSVPVAEVVPDDESAEDDSMLETELSHAERVKTVIIVKIIVFFIFHLASSMIFKYIAGKSLLHVRGMRRK